MAQYVSNLMMNAIVKVMENASIEVDQAMIADMKRDIQHGIEFGHYKQVDGTDEKILEMEVAPYRFVVRVTEDDLSGYEQPFEHLDDDTLELNAAMKKVSIHRISINELNKMGADAFHDAAGAKAQATIHLALNLSKFELHVDCPAEQLRALGTMEAYTPNFKGCMVALAQCDVGVIDGAPVCVMDNMDTKLVYVTRTGFVDCVLDNVPATDSADLFKEFILLGYSPAKVIYGLDTGAAKATMQ